MTSARLSLLIVLALMATGCFGPGASRPTQSASDFAPYTRVVPVNASGVELREPGPDEYFYVAINGSENWTLVKGAGAPVVPCTRTWAFSANPSNHTVLYNASRYALDKGSIRTVMGENLWGITFQPTRLEEGCPTAYGLRTYPAWPHPNLTRVFGSWGLIKVTVYRDGFLVFGDEVYLELGKKVVVSYGRLRAHTGGTYFVEGGFEVVNLGAWPKERLLQAAGGSVTRGPN